ncbi:ATP-binding protein [Chromobacterium haemolyticum]|uniref:ATP-binding protein n=1 Tax=Chromobacterium haemolyticum TaxID=394935 RepID=UPI00295482EE|nr:ATP-binding protein [Chromobacterium haemolyticum]WON82125.1 ATP-binding protein [Chromobacterium haemolyticum]
MVTDRNNRVGHGAFDKETARKYSAILDLCNEIIEIFSHLLPKPSETQLCIKSEPFILPLPKNNIYCIREIAQKASGWKLRAQEIDYNSSLEENFFLPQDNIIEDILAEKRDCLSSRKIEDWNITFVFPNPQTNYFVGREEEINRLAEWWDDEYSRACLIYGEGGIGKTTLCLEFVNQILSAHREVHWKPEYIFFFSSKKTRWGVNGLEEIPNVEANIAEAMRQLVDSLSLFKMDYRWLTESAKTCIQRTGTIISELGLKDKVLVVIDNAENLVQDKIQEEELARHLKVYPGLLGAL